MEKYKNKLSINGSLNLQTLYAGNDTVTAKKPRSEIKNLMNQMEYYVALVPDSTIKKNTEVDSIYSNNYKVKYIKKHKLVSARMKFADSK